QPATLSLPNLKNAPIPPGRERGFSNIRKLERPVENEAGGILKQGNIFQSEFSDEPAQANTGREDTLHPEENNVPEDTVPAPFPEDTAVAEADSTYIKMKAQPYRLSLKPDFFTVRLDNSILFMRYQSVRQTPGAFANPPLGGLLSVSL